MNDEKPKIATRNARHVAVMKYDERIKATGSSEMPSDSLPVGRAITSSEAARIDEGKAHVAAGGRGRSAEEMLADPRARLMTRFATWSLDEVRLLDYLVSLGRPIDVLKGQREATLQGCFATAISGAKPMPDMTDSAWVRSGWLDVLRATCVAVGIKVLPAPGSVQDSISELDKVKP